MIPRFKELLLYIQEKVLERPRVNVTKSERQQIRTVADQAFGSLEARKMGTDLPGLWDANDNIGLPCDSRQERDQAGEHQLEQRAPVLSAGVL